jgi:predicted lactoylglutathione lyase
MADETNKPAGGEVRPDQILENNAGVKAALEAQDINGKSTAAGDNEDIFGNAGDSLDKLRDEAVKKAEDEEPVVQPKADAVKPAAGEPKVEEGQPATEPKKDIFEDVHLPPGARPKSAEAFGQIKARAAQEISAREQQIEDLKKQVAERDEKLKSPVPAETEAELKNLREFRAKFDIEVDPKFKEFDAQVTKSEEFIYSLIGQNANLPKDTVELIKKHGGPANVKMEKIFEAMQDPQTAEIIKSQMSAAALAKFNKDQAIASAKKNVAGYIEERRKVAEQSATGHNEETRKEFDAITPKLPWFKKISPDAKASEPDKKAAEAHNAFVDDISGQVNAAMSDDSPHMRGVLLAGMAQLLFLQPRFQHIKEQNEGLKKQVEELSGKLEKFKGASVSRLDKSAAAKAGASDIKVEAQQDVFSIKAADSLDTIRNSILAEKARTGV